MNHEQKIELELMGLAIEAILGGKVPESGQYVLYGNTVIQRTTPSGLPDWSLVKNRDGKDFLASKGSDGIISLCVGEPDRHWLDCDHNIIYCAPRIETGGRKDTAAKGPVSFTGWLARDKNTAAPLSIYEYKPLRCETNDGRKFWKEQPFTKSIRIPEFFFPEITWKDEPVKVSISIEKI